MSEPMQDSHDGAELNPNKQLLMDAAEEIRKDQLARERSRPQNVGEGTLRLVGDTIGGAAIGAAAIVMGPVEGYKAAGAKGILGGTLGGLAMGVASTTFGIGSGLAHFAQGASRTASKLSPSEKDPRLILTDDTPRSVKDDYLTQRADLYEALMAEHAAESAAASMDGLSAPVDNSLYDTLDVSPEATPAQIRKAYYKMAQRYHPDKHPDNPEATEKFQSVSQAYQILSDPVKREEYHRVGADVTDDGSMVDPKALFALMFADFEHIVGDLATATILKSIDGAEGEAQDNETKAMQEQERAKKRAKFQEMRERQLVRLLERRLEPWLAGDEGLFISHAKNEVYALRKEPFGRDCLKTAGYIYRKRAAKVLEKGPLTGVTKFFDELGDKAHSVKSHIRALEGGLKAMTASSSAEADNETFDETARREAVNTLGAVWLASVVDIESTLRHVVAAVLESSNKERAKSPEVRRKAEGLMVLGKMFQQA